MLMKRASMEHLACPINGPKQQVMERLQKEILSLENLTRYRILITIKDGKLFIRFFLDETDLS